jgi:hypothetical protein
LVVPSASLTITTFHGQLTDGIRYKTAYLDNDGNDIQISFGLGNDMTVNTILGMPFIKDLGMVHNFRAGTVSCAESPAAFSIRYQETRCGFDLSDSDAAAFSDLPLDEMYPALLPRSREPATDVSSANSPLAATDDVSAGFLQWHLN